MTVVLSSLFFEFIVYLFIFIFGCAGSLLLCTGFILLQQARATLLCSALASHCGGFSCGAQALGTWTSVALTHRCVWNLPKPGIKPVSSALAVDSYLLQQGSLGFITWFSDSFHSSSIQCVLEMVLCSLFMMLCSFHSDKEFLGLENQSNKFKLREFIGKIQKILFESVASLPPRPHVKLKTDSFSICISLRLSIFSFLPFFLPLHLSVFLSLFLLSLSLFLSSILIFFF